METAAGVTEASVCEATKEECAGRAGERSRDGDTLLDLTGEVGRESDFGGEAGRAGEIERWGDCSRLRSGLNARRSGLTARRSGEG